MDYLSLFPALNPSEAAGLWALGLICPSRLPAIAETLLAEGCDVPALRRLAAEEPGSGSTGQWFEKAMQSLRGCAFGSARAAATYLIHRLATRIASGAAPAYLGAKAIWEISLATGEDALEEAHPFIYAASEYEDRPEDRDFFSRAIVEEARLLIDGQDHRAPVPPAGE